MRRDDKTYQSGEADQRKVRRPYDSRDLERLPQATDDDPPYRPWWIVDGSSSDGADPQA